MKHFFLAKWFVNSKKKFDKSNIKGQFLALILVSFLFFAIMSDDPKRDSINTTLDEIKEFLKVHADFENQLNAYLLSEQDVEEKFATLFSFISDKKYDSDSHEVEQLLYSISYVSRNFKRTNDFFDKIIRLITALKANIAGHYTNEQLFSIFSRVGPLVLKLQEQQILQYDEDINSLIRERPDLNAFFNAENEDIRKKRESGENINQICEFIRADQLSQFTQEISTINMGYTDIIAKSPFETHEFLKDKDVSIVQYAAFFGASQIFNHIWSSENFDATKTIDSLWVYALLGGNPEILQKLHEFGQGALNPDIVKECSIALIQHHGDLSILENFGNEIWETQEQPQQEGPKPFYLHPYLSAALESHNFSFLLDNFDQITNSEAPHDLVMQEFFVHACKADLYEISKKILYGLPFINVNVALPYNPLHLSAIYGLYNTFELMLGTINNEAIPKQDYYRRALINAQSYDMAVIIENDERADGLTALELAIQYGHYYIFDKLLNHPDIQLQGPDSVSRWRGNSPVQICAKFGRNRMLQILFEKKKSEININYCNMEVHTLHNQKLIPKGGKLSALHWAVLSNNAEAVRILIDQGIDISLKNLFDKTARDLANEIPNINPLIIQALSQ